MDETTIAVSFTTVQQPCPWPAKQCTCGGQRSAAAHPKPSKRWIQTLENRILDPLALTVEMVGSIEEIAHALAGEFRFTRQTQQRYTVAEHCVRGSRLLPAAFAGAFLLHELSEVYLPDIAGPIKGSVFIDRGGGQVTSWSDLERHHTATILQALGLSSLEPMIYSPEIKRMDLAMLAAEKRDLCGAEPAPWGLPYDPPAGCQKNALCNPWPCEEAERQFLVRFHELFS